MRVSSSPRSGRLRAAVAGAALLLAGGIVLTGCTGPGPDATAGPSEAPTAVETATAPPVLLPDGSAADNLPLFTEVMQRVAASDEAVAGRAYVDALVAAGFDKSAMQVTADRTTVDDPVDSLQFSVLWGQECLVGQVGPSTPAPTALVVPALPSGGCLLGLTRPIDW